ncbi:TauD-domain-containing protein [Mycena pura]|uniref:TauD-domain-containing protein n=1 Tax=Mycena pura TaxID=153505 RepID=A0AAD6VTL9_9AGAR|nr:TauD-domain-containing protein [Mycena pura]
MRALIAPVEMVLGLSTGVGYKTPAETQTQATYVLRLPPGESVDPLTLTLPGQPTPEQRGQGSFDVYPYKHLLPEVFPTADGELPRLEDFEHVDPGHRALKHANPRSFLAGATRIFHLTPAIGTEVHGVSLAKLSFDERDQLALEVARRGMMFWKKVGSHFGYPQGLPEIHMIYRDENTVYFETDHTSTTMWHTYMSFERQPPAETGGDTLFASGVAALKRLSPAFVAYLRTLKQIQIGVDPVVLNRGGRRKKYSRRDVVTTVHPIIRKHPVTGEESLFVNPECTQSIVGYKKEESDLIIKFLYNHIAAGIDSQARARWEPGTVVVWDNRNCLHSALFDYAGTKARRHGARITPQAERPIPALDGLDLSAP